MIVTNWGMILSPQFVFLSNWLCFDDIALCPSSAIIQVIWSKYSLCEKCYFHCLSWFIPELYWHEGLFISQIRMCPIYFLLSETFYLLYHMFINCVLLTVALPFYLSFMSVCCLMYDDSLILCTWILVNSSPTPPILLLWSKHLNGSQSDISGFYEPLRLKSFIQGRSTVQKSQGTQMSLYFFFRKTDAAIYWKMQKQMGMQLLREKQSSLVTSRTWKPMFVWTAFIL